MVNFLLELFDVNSIFFHQFEDRSDGSLVANRHVIFIFVEDKLIAFLVDGVVGEVHADILNVVLIRDNIAFSCKSGQSFMVEINSKRIDSSYEDIESEIKLQSIDEVGLADVSLDDASLVWGDIL